MCCTICDKALAQCGLFYHPLLFIYCSINPTLISTMYRYAHWTQTVILIEKNGVFFSDYIVLCVVTNFKISLCQLFLAVDTDGRKLKGGIQRSTETGLAVEMPSRTVRQASHESIEDSMNSYGSEGKWVTIFYHMATHAIATGWGL